MGQVPPGEHICNRRGGPAKALVINIRSSWPGWCRRDSVRAFGARRLKGNPDCGRRLFRGTKCEPAVPVEQTCGRMQKNALGKKIRARGEPLLQASHFRKDNHGKRGFVRERVHSHNRRNRHALLPHMCMARVQRIAHPLYFCLC